MKQRESLRKEILRILAIDDLVPPRWDLILTRHGTIERDGYRIERLTFESYPGFANAAILYIPTNTRGRIPGIVSISGHIALSKAAEYVQRRNVNLVKRGCIVLSYDYFGYGDRKTGNDPVRPEGPNAHGIRSFSYSRRCATTLEVLDAIWAVDVLTMQPDVDPERIAFTGESGGGNSTYWIAALDPRVKLARRGQRFRLDVAARRRCQSGPDRFGQSHDPPRKLAGRHPHARRPRTCRYSRPVGAIGN
ncbi:MAG TPA: acetylxylan esterase [Planctomycetaceae bacterium]